MSIKLLVGLRNPGSTYAKTRHNAGAWFVEALAASYKASFKSEKTLHADMASLSIDTHACRAILPLTFMNHSGLAVRAVSQFYRIASHELLVVHDELDLPVGSIKLKTGGGHGGHNGLRDLINHLGHTDFHRLRIGIGHPGHKDLVLDYVLGKPSQHEQQCVSNAIERGIDVMPIILSKGIEAGMCDLNKR